MSVRAAQAKALQQLQALRLRQWGVRQTTAADYLSSAAVIDRHIIRITGQQAYMTTGQPFSSRIHRVQSIGSVTQHQQQQQVPDKQMHKKSKQGVGFTTPSPSSSMSDYCHLDRPQLTVASASTKSAKRKAAEALLAARYSSSSITAAAVTFPAVSAAAQLQHKRHRSSLASVIDKFTEDAGTAAAGNHKQSSSQLSNASAAATAAAAASASASTQQKPQLVKLQQVLKKLHGQHKQLIQQPQHHRQVLQHHQQQQQPQQQESCYNLCEEELGVAVAAGNAAGRQEQHAAAGGLQQYVQVPACNSSCAHVLSQGWCHTQVRLPHVDWGRVLEMDMSKVPSYKVAKAYERMTLPDGVQVLVVENPAYLQNALQQLRASMQDPIVAIDLEWRPSHGRQFTPVAMIQLASSRTAVLIRTCRMNHRLPAALRDFLKDPAITLVGFGWGSSDEPKMQSTFGLGSKDFGRFLDLQAVAQGLGYCGFGLARLTVHVLGLHLPKSKKVSMSDWEAVVLTKTQVKYAALDVLIAGQVFRALRLWHSSPSLCEVCHYNLGSTSSSSVYICTCGKSFTDIRGYLSHCAIAYHKPRFAECSGCGCTRQLPWPTGSSNGSEPESACVGTESKE